MINNLETADTLVKLFLSIFVILLYSVGVLSGPFAIFLVVLSCIILIIFIIKTILKS